MSHNYTFGPPAGGWDAWKTRASRAEKATQGTGPGEPGPTRTIYLGGPMRGLPAFNFPTFDRAALVLQSLGWKVLSPADHDREALGDIETAPGFAEGDVDKWVKASGFAFSVSMQWDLAAVIRADAIALLPGWQNSLGARYERAVAEVCGRDVYLFSTDLSRIYRDPQQSCMRVTVGRRG